MTSSDLIPRNMTVHITVNHITHPLIPPRTTHMDIPRHIHLFLDPRKRSPYLFPTHKLTDQTTHRLELTTNLFSTVSMPERSQRSPMMRTESHAPNGITTLTFPVESPQHQLSIMTLVTHLLLLVPSMTAQQSWNIVRDGDTHQHTLQLILVTITLRRYHKF